MKKLLALLMMLVVAVMGVGCVDLPTEVRVLHCIVDGELVETPNCVVPLEEVEVAT